MMTFDTAQSLADQVNFGVVWSLDTFCDWLMSRNFDLRVDDENSDWVLVKDGREEARAY